ncbi:MAG: ABC transporter permease [Pseudomonadota bacterium]
MSVLDLIQVLDATIRLSVPLLLACLAGLLSERAGIFDIGLEGKMLMSAFFSAAVAYIASTSELVIFNIVPGVVVGLLAGILASIFLSLIHGAASITFRGNQLISGVAINFLAAGLTVVLAQTWFGQAGRTPQLTDDGRFYPIELPGALTRIVELRDASPMMQVYSELLSGHSILVFIALIAVPVVWWGLFRTRFGLRLRAVGENPAAVDTAGISVVRLRYAAVILCGVLCGLAGAYMSTALQAGFTKDMSAGRGYIALAALIFAKWRPWYALWACLLFGFLQAITLRPDLLQALMGFRLQAQLLDAMPYILTVVILAGIVGRADPPRAGGAPYVKER